MYEFVDDLLNNYLDTQLTEVQGERIIREYIEDYYMVIRPHISLGEISSIQYILNHNLLTKTQK